MNQSGFVKALVIAEHKERYIVQIREQTYQAEITGQLRFTATSPEDFPTVGDSVKVNVLDDRTAIIISIDPRKTQLKRKAVAKASQGQMIAANIDCAFIMQSVGHDFNLNRLQRYLSICFEAGIEPVIILSKIDLLEANELTEYQKAIQERIEMTRLIPLSSQNGAGTSDLIELLTPGKTYCFLGSSGVGKSSLVNFLMQTSVMATKGISDVTNKGKHTTSYRHLFTLPNGSRVIDTPGMRELGMTDMSQGIEMTFSRIVEQAQQCKFKDCRHEDEPGCAIRAAIDAGILSAEAYENYLKLKLEEARFSSSKHEKRRKDRAQGKFYKSVMARKKKMREDLD